MVPLIASRATWESSIDAWQDGRAAKKALVAVAHSILVIIYHVLKEETTYQELGSTYFEERERDAVKRRALRSLERLGYDVSLQEKGAVA
jgi:hypothetical protein